MQITMVSPLRPSGSSGNDVTATRWARRLDELGHHVTTITISPDMGDGFVVRDIDFGPDPDLIVVLHARRCAAAVATSSRQAPDRPIVVALTGTDLYADLPADLNARASVDRADRLIVLQPAAIDRLAGMGSDLADKAHVVYQSVDAEMPPREVPGRFTVVVLAHMREVKDPFLAARAAALLPTESQVIVMHAGGAHGEDWARSARREERNNPRYQWVGELSREDARDLLSGATVLACTSRMEGGANVVTEAIALGVPVVGTIIDGNVGLLGEEYPGLVPVGDAERLAGLIHSLETEPSALADLQARVDSLSEITNPDTERSAWQNLLTSLVPDSSQRSADGT